MKQTKLNALIALITVCAATAVLGGSGKTTNTGKFWVAVTYEMSEHGASNGQSAAIGAFGVLHGAMEGAIWGSVFGGPAGAAAGIVAGM
jgi:hypothetical protein